MKVRQERFHGSTMFQDQLEIYVNRFQENFHSDFHSHDFIEITYVAEGTGFHHIGEHVFPVRKGDLFILPLGTTHVFRPVSPSKHQKLIVYNCIFTESMLYKANEDAAGIDLLQCFQSPTDMNASLCHFDGPNQRMESLFQQMLDEHTVRKPGYAALLYSLLLQLLIYLARQFSEPDQAKLHPQDSMEHILQYIRNHVDEPLTIRSMAELCRISERHFFRLFKQRTGQPFQDFVQHTRVQASCELLLRTNLTIAPIAEAVGYKDLQSFHQVFKRIVGMTPGQYRKQGR
jgi:AraC family L-rhamnose operon transcriptional activator RhaR